MSCSVGHTCQFAPDPSKNGQGCGAGLVCNGGACIAPGAVCGNGTLEGGEDCDFGGSNGPGTGCENNCKFSCTKNPDSCVDINACHDAPTCTTVSVNGKTGQKCSTGATKSDGAVCGVGSICLGGICAPSVCGDAYRDGTRGEQCDDGNVVNLDACDGACKFEQTHRVTSLQMLWDEDAYCTVNALGGAVGSAARNSFQGDINTGVRDGSVSSLFTFAAGADLAGASGPATIGSLSGNPTTNAAPYDGRASLDWWYTPNPEHIDANRKARAMLTGSFSGSTLDATGTMNLMISVGGGLANMAVYGAKLQMAVSAVNTPAVAAANAPPGHVAAEHLAPNLQSFSAGGNTSSSPNARMCGNVSAASLNETPVPLTLLPGGSYPCKQGYTTANRFIDVLVNGCTAKVFIDITVIRPTPPDQVTGQPAAGQGAPYTLQIDPSSKRVTGCQDKSGASVSLQSCLAAAAYSVSFRYATNRVIVR